MKYIYSFIFIIMSFCSCSESEKRISFNNDVRPILNKNCISCHGGVKQSGEIGFVFREDALKKGTSGEIAIIPGNAEESEFYKRLVEKNNLEERMPLEKDPLTEKEIKLIKQWINQGAVWEEHWAFKNSKVSEIPDNGAQWAENSIDNFVYRELENQGLLPNEKADKITLIRRLSLDIIGLPPAQELVNLFVNNEITYEKLTDTLLSSKRFGEKWASMWLDLARYGDTRGYEKDLNRDIWKYRDWVIEALNNNMPFDEFTKKQLAGDLLPERTEKDLIATAFHRNTMINDEAGTDNEEFRVMAVLDRVNTTYETWQGITMGCVQCHGHPYDPLKHKDYFTSYAFFNNTQDADGDDDYPVFKGFSEENKVLIDTYISKLNSSTNSNVTYNKADELYEVLYPSDADEFNIELADKVSKTRVWLQNVETDPFIKYSKLDLKNVKYLIFDIQEYVGAKNVDISLEIRLNSPNGKLIGAVSINPEKAEFQHYLKTKLDEQNVANDIYFIFKSNPKSHNILKLNRVLLLKSEDKFSNSQNTLKYNIVDSILSINPDFTVPIMVENEEELRKSYMFEKGNWLDHGEEVEPTTPPLLNPFDNYESNRLGFANWITSPDNPLTSRVIVNRYWEQIFGIGLVETLEDFGSQGEKPSHPELLDWLSQSFITNLNWSVKDLIKLMVNSATYKQSSIVSNEKLEKDPRNKYYARATRLRLTSEQIRDQALYSSGLISYKMYGKGVMPPQPDGVWNSIASKEEWITSSGDDRYRRSIYTYWKKSSPYPSFITFDAPSREFCVSRRIRTNTPLQALIILNDPVYFEAANYLAKKENKINENVDEIIRSIYRKCLYKDPEETIFLALKDLYNFTMNEKEENEITDSEKKELALTAVASAILNLDMYLTRY